MKRIIPLLACALLLPVSVFAESLPEQTPAPTAAPTPVVQQADALQVDFSMLQLDNPLATPVAVDPIDKPTPTPAPTPNYAYTSYENSSLGCSFSVPYSWLLNPNTPQDTLVQFVEPQSEMMDIGGYQTRLTIEKVNIGLAQTAANARDRLQDTLEELGSTFTSFTPGDLASVSVDGANGYYCYYRAEYNDGNKTYTMRGRILIVAHDRSLYQIRITTPSAWYSYYEYVFRKVRSSFRFL